MFTNSICNKVVCQPPNLVSSALCDSTTTYRKYRLNIKPYTHRTSYMVSEMRLQKVIWVNTNISRHNHQYFSPTVGDNRRYWQTTWLAIAQFHSGISWRHESYLGIYFCETIESYVALMGYRPNENGKRDGNSQVCSPQKSKGCAKNQYQMGAKWGLTRLGPHTQKARRILCRHQNHYT